MTLHSLGDWKSIQGDREADADGRVTNVFLAIITGLMIGMLVKSSTGKGNIDFAQLSLDAMGAIQSFMRWQIDNWFLTIPIVVILVIMWVKYGYIIHHFFRMGGY